MSFMFMVFHYPKPEYRDELLRRMVEMAGFFSDKRGFIDAGPWVEESGERIVGISIWESKEARLAAGSPPWTAISGMSGVAIPEVKDTLPPALDNLSGPAYPARNAVR